MAALGVADIFTDKCVLQRNKNIVIWGTGKEESVVTARIDGNVSSSKVKDGRWKLILDPMEATKGKTLVVSDGKSELSFHDVAIGEVWLAGGQSNMEYELKDCTGGREMMDSDSPNVRFYYTPKYEYESPKYEHLKKEAHWESFDEPGKTKWSAVGYIFAKELSEKLGVTVGVIGCNWGGTSASAWMAESDLREDKELAVYFEEYDKNTQGVSFDEQERSYEEYLDYRSRWEPECARLYETVPGITWDEVIARIGDSRYPGPINACNPMRPSGLYKTMLSKVIGYTLAGVIYYQGESDDHLPRLYDRLFKKMILRWRHDNGDEKLPFLAVELPMHRYSQDPDFKNWPIIRKNQRKVSKELENVGIAVCTDLGEFNEIHPHDKRGVAHRLFLQALWLVYHLANEDEANGPLADKCKVEGGKVTVHFAHAGSGLIIKGDELTGFEISDGDPADEESFVPAKAVINGDNVIVSSESVKAPTAVRYLWTNYGDVTLYGKNGICAEPFEFRDIK